LNRTVRRHLCLCNLGLNLTLLFFHKTLLGLNLDLALLLKLILQLSLRLGLSLGLGRRLRQILNYVLTLRMPSKGCLCLARLFILREFWIGQLRAHGR